MRDRWAGVHDRRPGPANEGTARAASREPVGGIADLLVTFRKLTQIEYGLRPIGHRLVRAGIPEMRFGIERLVDQGARDQWGGGIEPADKVISKAIRVQPPRCAEAQRRACLVRCAVADLQRTRRRGLAWLDAQAVVGMDWWRGEIEFVKNSSEPIASPIRRRACGKFT